MTSIAAVRAVVPEHRYSQAAITDALVDFYGVTGREQAMLRRLHANAGVQYRHLAIPPERYERLTGFGATNAVFLDVALDLGEQAVRGVLADAGRRPSDIDLVMFVSVTGIAAPSVDARLAGRLGMRPDVKRLPIFGLGCVAGAAGIARLHDYLVARPEQVALLLSVELCTLTLQRDDVSPASMVASALFGDGAAAVLMTGAAAPAPDAEAEAEGDTDTASCQAVRWPEVVATRATLYPDTEHLMGWQVTDGGLRVVLDPGVPDAVRGHLADDVRRLLDDHGLKSKDVTAWVCHAGGPKVLDAVVEALDLPEGALDITRASLAAQGNLSSAAVLHVLRDTVLRRRPPAGTPGVLLAMGPGFCSELVLLRW